MEERTVVIKMDKKHIVVKCDKDFTIKDIMDRLDSRELVMVAYRTMDAVGKKEQGYRYPDGSLMGTAGRCFTGHTEKIHLTTPIRNVIYSKFEDWRKYSAGKTVSAPISEHLKEKRSYIRRKVDEPTPTSNAVLEVKFTGTITDIIASMKSFITTVGK